VVIAIAAIADAAAHIAVIADDATIIAA